MSKNLKKLLIAVMVLAMAMTFAACGGGSGEEAPAEDPAVSTESGAISVTPLDIPDYITEAKAGDEEILMAREGDGAGSGSYVLIDGSVREGEDITWEMRCPSWKNGEEYTLDMMLADFEAKDTYGTEEYTKVTIGDYEYLEHEANSTSMNYYTVNNNHPVLVQVVGTDEMDEEAVMNAIKSIKYNY
ncbi:MAG: hypothetical protein ACI4KL_01480 [Lentihominibacter sp.]